MSAIDIRKTSYEKIFGLLSVFPRRKKNRLETETIPVNERTKRKGLNLILSKTT
ncbi:hypothetical protein LEP1GSC038_0754 [Leptospira weilii str. 2006001855]|uniref:Uncharacterized protein n=1 Tax=Leptospira weilii str. 2006001855 TaxID=996804 RepID=M6FQV2_9LEPT|nr:hypothetical protein LEP1GSC038_0754 [Leptospira weilii str. 2006001855]